MTFQKNMERILTQSLLAILIIPKVDIAKNIIAGILILDHSAMLIALILVLTMTE